MTTKRKIGRYQTMFQLIVSCTYFNVNDQIIGPLSLSPSLPLSLSPYLRISVSPYLPLSLSPSLTLSLSSFLLLPLSLRPSLPLSLSLYLPLSSSPSLSLLLSLSTSLPLSPLPPWNQNKHRQSTEPATTTLVVIISYQGKQCLNKPV